MAVKIVTPNRSFEGLRAGIRFSKGTAVFENEELGVRVANSLGYEVLKVCEDAVEALDIQPEDKKPSAKKKAATRKVD